MYAFMYTCHNRTGIVIEGPSNVTYLPGLTTLPIKLTCTVNGVYIVAWEVNGRTYRLAELDDGELSGHSRNGSNMLVNRPVNNTKYICVSQANDDTDFSDPSYIIIAGEQYVYTYVCAHVFELFNSFNKCT